MENTNENKVKFFAQHWGQKFRYQGSIGTVRYIGGITRNWNIIDASDVSEHRIAKCMLEVTPLSEISDEDIFNVGKIGCFTDIEKIEFFESEDGILWQVFFTVPKCGKNSTIEPTPNFVIDYLRSKGYALSWMGLSIEELLKRGWIRLYRNM